MQDDFLLKAKAMGINTQQEPIVYLHRDSHICRAEGFSANSRVMVYAGNREVIATLDVVENHILDITEIGLSNIALQRLAQRWLSPMHRSWIPSGWFARKFTVMLFPVTSCRRSWKISPPTVTAMWRSPVF